jgi:hypothetical protein
MPLVVHALGSYATYSDSTAKWRQEDYNVCKLVKSIKGEEFNGYTKMQDTNGRWVRFDRGSNANSMFLFSDWAAKRLLELELGEVVLVPVPSHACVAFEYESAPSRMARSLAALSRRSATVERWLRFNRVMPASHEGGGRDQATIEASLVVSPDVRACRIVLIDDVKTSGAHLRACANALRRVGATVEVAIVAGATTQTQVENPLEISPVDLEAQLNFF